MLTMSFLWFLSCIACMTSLSSALFLRVGSKHYIANNTLMTNKEAITNCNDLGARVPTFETKNEIDALSQLKIQCFWLDGNKTQGGYHFNGSADGIPTALWAPNEPSCDGDCGILVCPTSGLLARTKSERHYYLCVIDLPAVAVEQATKGTKELSDKVEAIGRAFANLSTAIAGPWIEILRRSNSSATPGI